MKNRRPLYISIFLVALVCLFVILFFLFRPSDQSDHQKAQQGVRTPYRIPSIPTDLHEQLFKGLQDDYDQNNHEAVAAYVGQLMLSDFFTWSNKSSRSDVGGMQYLLDDEVFKKEFFTQALNNYYGFFEELRLKYTQEELPTVIDVQWLETQPAEFSYGDMLFDEVIKMSFRLEYDATKRYDISTLYLNYSVTMASINNVWYVVQIDVV